MYKEKRLTNDMSIRTWLQLPEAHNIAQMSDEELIRLHKRVLQKKSFLKRIYKDFYHELQAYIPERQNEKQVIVELGSGGGCIKEIIPDIITSDIIALPDVDKQFSALHMPFNTDTVDAFLMLNVFHHVPDSAAFLQEMERCLKKGGRIIMIEPANTVWGRFIYKHFHHEVFDPSAGWAFESMGPLTSANGALPWIVFARDKERFKKEFKSLTIKKFRAHTPFRYLLSGGITMRQLMPTKTYSLVVAIEYLFFPLNRFIGMFYTIIIEK